MEKVICYQMNTCLIDFKNYGYLPTAVKLKLLKLWREIPLN